MSFDTIFHSSPISKLKFMLGINFATKSNLRYNSQRFRSISAKKIYLRHIKERDFGDIDALNNTKIRQCSRMSSIMRLFLVSEEKLAPQKHFSPVEFQTINMN